MEAVPSFDTFTDAYTAVLARVTKDPQHVIAARGNYARECLNVSFTLHLLLHDGALHAVTYMRANDAVIGLLCDVLAFTAIQEFLGGHLGARLGTYTHHAVSMHRGAWTTARRARAG